MIIRVMGYKKEVSEEPTSNPSPGSNGGRGRFKRQTETGSEGEDKQGFQSATCD